VHFIPVVISAILGLFGALFYDRYFSIYKIIFCFSLGQFICGEKRCDEKEHLRSWEVLFSYVEHGKKRDALVKLSM
jgi:hypothetical protein